ncbi:MAG: hypothetical protein QOF49_814, partial [Chloroflexota bacterium]|nr:hypothetical protein [Chloroflexota bacterium]
PRAAVLRWARELVDVIAVDQTAQHISVFVPGGRRDRMHLVAQLWGAGEDDGSVVIGEWVIPIEGSIIGRVFRTASAALCADVSLDPDYLPFPGGRSRSCLTVPVGSPGSVVAVINIESPWASTFSIRDYENVAACAARAASTFPAPTA